ncbi:nucleoside deaminase [Chromobacterium sp. IIBBL 290-4]|uniref:nucleoside deaminase n=1 Tax=Chromobacterium sp. IIBBL 290-4 TaxID=2953890 RepID=UPI0020B83F65|nr:nucleoside deaminase [Chromobacterium sp. IIBBL 290-4]UTH72790.1 nucleoside deaminase [Chromobacterium sp. IIBBL 290-4]
MQELVRYSCEHVRQGGIPFASFVINGQGEILGRGVNRVLENHDPTAHAEVEAIRDACLRAGRHHLHGLTLLASGEPCAMCYLNAYYAGIREVIFAVDRDDAAAAGFDYRGSYRMLAAFPRQWAMQYRKLAVAGAFEPFKLFQAQNQRRCS